MSVVKRADEIVVGDELVSPPWGVVAAVERLPAVPGARCGVGHASCSRHGELVAVVVGSCQRAIGPPGKLVQVTVGGGGLPGSSG